MFKRIALVAFLALGFICGGAGLATMQPAQATPTTTPTATPVETGPPNCMIEPWQCGSPSPTVSPTSSATASPKPSCYVNCGSTSPKPRAKPKTSPMRTPAAAELPQTPIAGGALPYVAGGGVVLLVAGGMLLFAARTRRYSA